MTKKKKLTEAEILSLAYGSVADAEKLYNGQLSREIENNIKYYMGELPAPARQGTSRYVSQDVWDCVESLKAQLLETFSGNRILVRFAPQGPEDVEPARLATEVANYVWSRYNNGYLNSQAVIHNGLMARNGIVKITWKKETDWHEETFTGVPPDALAVLASEDSVELLEIEQDELTGLVSGKLKRSYDKSNVAVDVVPPEEFIISSAATCKSDANTIGQRVLKSKSDLRKEGYDKAKIDKLGSTGDGGTVIDSIQQARMGYTGDKRDSSYQDAVEEFWIYELYKYMDIEGTGEARLYKVICAEGVLFEYEEVDSIPFFSFVPLPIPHSFYGASFCDRAIHIQNAKTTITRGVLEHTVITNNPRMMVLKGGLKNPRELLDNRLGGIININRPDALMPVPQAPMNQFAFSVLEKMDADKEDNTGVSRLSKGLNKDAISKQNSADMVSELTGLSMQRQKMIARNFAEGFLRDVFLYIYELVCKNAGPEYYAEIAGQYQKINVATWRERKDAIVEFTIGYQEDEAEFMRSLSIHQMLSADPAMAPMYTMDKKYNVIGRALQAKGIRDIDSYLTPPDQVQPPQPDPLVMQDMQNQTMLAQVRMMEAETTRMKFLHEAEMDKRTFQVESMVKATQAASTADKSELDRDKFEHDKKMDAAELSIVKKQSEQGAVTASANVNSKG